MTNERKFGQPTPECHAYDSIYLIERAELHHLNTSQKKGIISQYTDVLEIKFPAQKAHMDVSGHNKPTVVIL